MKKLQHIGTLILFVLLFFSCQYSRQSSSPESLDDLRQAIVDREYYFKKRLSQIDSIQSRLHSSNDPVGEFKECKALFNIYYDFQIDSALRYAQHMLKLSEGILNPYPIYRTEASFLIARVYTYSGMYKEASQLLSDALVQAGPLPDNLRELCFVVQMQLYKGLADQTISQEDLKVYQRTIDANRDSLIAITPEGSVWHFIHLSNKIKAEGNYELAKATLLKAYNQLTTDDRDMAHVAFYMSDLYRLQSDVEQEKQYLMISSIADIKHAVKEYVSLWKLGTVLYDEGDIETAYQFIEISLQDAIYSGAYRWKQYIIRILPSIYTRYNATIIQQKNTISSAFWVIVSLLGCSVLLSVYIVRQYRKLDHAKSQLSGMNTDLKKINMELITANLLKETYLSKFIDLCSDYIDKLDAYRGNLKRLFKGGKVEKIEKELHSTKYIEKEHKSFLLNFDETFLTLYPHFISEFNSLLPEEYQQKTRENELLTTELRVFALIRLGITDSNKIAKFLRCSITTIYTYRSKLKNKSYYPDSFEERIKGHQFSSPVTNPLDQHNSFIL